jgi:hypothetical protein
MPTMTHRGATALAAKVLTHWIGKGTPLPKVWVEEQKVARNQAPVFVVRSDMLNGTPRLRG